MAILGSGNDNINIDGATSSFIDFGGADTYTLLGSLSGDVTITDNQASTINLPDGLTVSDAMFLSDGVQFTIDGNTVTLLGDPALFTFVFGGTPLDASAGTPLTFEETAVAFGTTVPAAGEAPNAATNTGDINDDGTVAGGAAPVTFDLTGPASTGEAEAATYTVTASAPVTEDTDVTFQLAAGDQAAADQGTNDTNLNDFTQGSFTEVTVTIPTGGTTATFEVTPRSDGITELTEDYSVSASVGATDLTPVTTSIIDGGGETFILTTDVDNVIDPVDIVRGLINDDGTTDNDTFSSGDFIQGTGNTELRLSLVDVDGGTPDFVEMDGVNAITFRGAGETATVTFDAASYGPHLNIFTLSGADDADVVVENVDFDDGPLIFDIAPGTTGDLEVAGEAGPFTTFSAELDTTGDEGASLISDIGNAGIEAFAGEDANIDMDADIEVTETGADAIIDDVIVGDVDLVAGTDASVDVSISLSAEANTSGDAGVGDVTIGLLDLAAGNSADADFSMYRYAYADEGDATIGDLILGDVSMNGTAEDAEVFLYLSASATADDTGNAMVGDTTIGNVDIDMVTDASEATFSIYNFAYADTGNAVVGDLLIGDIAVDTGNDVTGDIYIEASQSATADTSGDATVGDLTIGNVDAVLGDSTDLDLYASLEADADSGDATAGSIAVGDVTVALGEEAELSLYLSAEADADAGDTATVGDVSIGNVMLTQDSGAEAYIYAYAYATATGAGHGITGNLSVGDITSEMGLSSTLEVFVSASAGGSGTMTSVGDVSVGNITLSGPVALDVDAQLSVTIESDRTIGSVTVGDVDVDFLDDSTFDYFVYLETSGSDDAIGAVNLGDVDIVADSIDYEVSMYGDLTAGVTIGDVMLSGDDIDWQSIYMYASADIGDVNIGDIMLDDATAITIDTGVFISGTDDVGNIAIGDVTIDAPNAETFNIDLTSGENMGNVDLGNVDLTARSGLFLIDVNVAVGEDAGDVTVGDVSLVASDGATASFDIDVTAVDTPGDVAIGDVSLMGTVSATANSALVNFSADSEGDLTVGDIAVVADYTGTAAVGAAPVGAVDLIVDLDASNNILIGDINVSGGIVGTGMAMDNLAVLTTWLDTTAGGTVTVGDVDYSGYEVDATIDVSGMGGAANIMAGSEDTEITVNNTQNTVTLNSGDDTVIYAAEELSGTTYADIDKISAFASGSDLIDFTAFGLGGTAGIGGTVADYDDFLTTAQAAMTFDDFDVFTMTDGTNTYVAVNSDDDPSEIIDFVVELTGVTTVATGDFSL